MRYETLRLLVNALTANFEYSRSTRENLPMPIQLKLSKISSIFSGSFFYNFAIYSKFPMFLEKYEPHRSSIFEVIDSERCAYLNA